MNTQQPRLAIVVKGFPRLSETFIARELSGLEQRGIIFSLHALRAPGPDGRLAVNRVAARPNYLPEYLHNSPLEVFRCFLVARRLTGFSNAWAAFKADLRRDQFRARVRRFGQACVLALQMPGSVRHVHAHFMHSPSSVARYAAMMRGISFSMSAHAKDIWTTPKWDLSQKLNEAAFVSVCNRAGLERLSLLSRDGHLAFVAHGVSSDLLAMQAPQQVRDGQDPKNPVRLITVARAVEKKGLGVLLDAMARLPSETSFRWDHFGDGALLSTLKQRASDLGLSKNIEWHGAQPHRQIVNALDQSDLFVLSAVVGRDGDRDGIPNALMEAQARGLCCLASDTGGVSEAIANGSTGEIIRTDCPNDLAQALNRFIGNPTERFARGKAALEWARREYDEAKGHDIIAALLREHAR